MTRRQWLWLWIWLLLFLIIFCVWNRLQTIRNQHQTTNLAPVIFTDKNRTASPVATKDISLKLVKSDGTLRLSGVFPSQKALDDLIARLEAEGEHVEKGAVIIDPKADNDKLLALVPTLAQKLAHVENGMIDYHEKHLVIEGDTDDPNLKAELKTAVAALGSGYMLDNRLLLHEVQPPAAEEKTTAPAPKAEAEAQKAEEQQKQAPKAETAPKPEAKPQPSRADLQHALDKILSGKRVEFLYAKNELTPKSKKILDQVAQALQRYPGLRIEIGGHTDSDGTEVRNLILSQKRAETVKKYLVQKGIVPDRLVAKGYGESRPLVKNDTPAHKQRNRRVEFRVINQ